MTQDVLECRLLPKVDLFNPVLGGKSYTGERHYEMAHSSAVHNDKQAVHYSQKSSVQSNNRVMTDAKQSNLGTKQITSPHATYEGPGTLGAHSIDRSPVGKGGHVEHVKVKYRQSDVDQS